MPFQMSREWGQTDVWKRRYRGWEAEPKKINLVLFPVDLSGLQLNNQPEKVKGGWSRQLLANTKQMPQTRASGSENWLLEVREKNGNGETAVEKLQSLTDKNSTTNRQIKVIEADLERE